MRERNIVKRYMYFCKACGHLSFHTHCCEACGAEKMEETPKRYGLTNLACISMAVIDFEALKQEFAADYSTGQCVLLQNPSV
ncbi:MAG: hypothetical protein K2P44_00465 [Lachnospiraceae bacterium]|nr:hypothetical protein [Lachnospiraceae bacterium]